MHDAYIVSALRTAVGKAGRGTLRETRPDDLAAIIIAESVKRIDGLEPENVDDVILGCAMPEMEQGMNMARIAAIRAGLPSSVPGFTINRFCSSGLQAIALASDRIRVGAEDVIIAGGAESMSLIPMTGRSVAPNPHLVEFFPEIYISMGLTAENLQRKYNISREDQDAFAYGSHQKALAAIQEGFFRDEIVPVAVERCGIDASGRMTMQTTTFDTDEGPRPDTSLERLAALRPVFKVGGTVTAGNASQTSDGAAAAIVMSGAAVKKWNVTPVARLMAFAVAGVPPELMGIGPVEAIPKALKQAGLTLDDIDLIELNEAFAVQALAVLREAGLDPEKVNVNGGAVALGHPLGCSGAKLTATLLHEMPRRKAKYGMVTMCIGGGQGAAGIFEYLQ